MLRQNSLAMTASIPMAAILGCAGPVLQPDEGAFFRARNPLGFILFARNCETPQQLRRLTQDLRSAVGRPDAPVLMDHEGGRVQRLPHPPWRKVPPPAAFAALPSPTAATAVRLNAQLMAMELLDLGVDVNCVPCLDVNDPAGHHVIGDRAYSISPDVVAQLGRALVEGLARGGVLPVIKHMPGHGRALVDSHLELPVVEATFEALAERDFVPFKALADVPLGMTAHVLYPDLDGDHPATLSQAIIDGVIRRHIGFDGLLLTDDLSMQALGGDIGQQAAKALAAGCDVALHCNGKMAEMQAVAAHVQALSGAAMARWQNARLWSAQRRQAAEDVSHQALAVELAALI